MVPKLSLLKEAKLRKGSSSKLSTSSSQLLLSRRAVPMQSFLSHFHRAPSWCHAHPLWSPASLTRPLLRPKMGKPIAELLEELRIIIIRVISLFSLLRGKLLCWSSPCWLEDHQMVLRSSWVVRRCPSWPQRCQKMLWRDRWFLPPIGIEARWIFGSYRSHVIVKFKTKLYWLCFNF